MQTRYELMLDSVCRVWGFERELLEFVVPLLLDAQMADGKESDARIDARLDAMGLMPVGERQEPDAQKLLRSKDVALPADKPKGPGKAPPKGDKKPPLGGKWPPVMPTKEAEALRADVLEYMTAHKVTRKALAADIMLAETTVHKLLSGDQILRQHHADMLRGWLDKQRGETAAAPQAEASDVDAAVRHILGEDG